MSSPLYDLVPQGWDFGKTKFFNITNHKLIYIGHDLSKEISLEYITTIKQVKLIQELDPEEKS